jgi:hypothetical protein
LRDDPIVSETRRQEFLQDPIDTTDYDYHLDTFTKTQITHTLRIDSQSNKTETDNVFITLYVSSSSMKPITQCVSEHSAQ